jgi:hypothetical protein
MAAVAGVTAAQLCEAGREDAARELARQQQQRLPGEEMLERLRGLDPDQARELLATIAVQLGISPREFDDEDDEPRYGT